MAAVKQQIRNIPAREAGGRWGVSKRRAVQIANTWGLGELIPGLGWVFSEEEVAYYDKHRTSPGRPVQ